MQAPHMLVLVFARGLLRHLLTRVYFEEEPGNTADMVLQEIPAERRATLIARLRQSSDEFVSMGRPSAGPERDCVLRMVEEMRPQ